MDTRGGTAVLVDDDSIFREFARELLESLAWTVHDFYDGARMLAWLDGRPPPTFVILDMKMPGLDGPDVLRRAVERHPNLPVLLCTGLDRWQVDKSLFSLGKVGYLPKPLGVGDLKRELSALGLPITGSLVAMTPR
jgi:CheY-like chemotaxis protein